MTQILTDDEIKQLDTVSLHWKDFDEVEIYAPSVIEFARAIEQAILNKLSKQKPVAWFDEKLGCFDEKHFDQLYPLYLHPSPSLPDVDSLAQFIRNVDGNNSMGAGELAENITNWLTARSE